MEPPRGFESRAYVTSSNFALMFNERSRQRAPELVFGKNRIYCKEIS